MRGVTLLRRARKRLAQGWCQGQAAVDRDGFPAGADSSRAVAWCLTGALEAEVGRDGWYKRQEMIEATLLLNLAESRVKGGPIWNNVRTRTQQQVLDVVDRAIAIGQQPPADVTERIERVILRNVPPQYRELYEPSAKRLARLARTTSSRTGEQA